MERQMNCSDLRQLLIEHLDGRLDAGRDAEARAHLASCPSCSREADAHRRTWALVGRLGTIEPNPGFVQAVHARIHRSRVRTLLAGLAAAAAVVVALMFAQQPSPPSEATLSRLAPEDRALLEDLARDRTWELADNIEVVRAYELLETNGTSPEEDH